MVGTKRCNLNRAKTEKRSGRADHAQCSELRDVCTDRMVIKHPAPSGRPSVRGECGAVAGYGRQLFLFFTGKGIMELRYKHRVRLLKVLVVLFILLPAAASSACTSFRLQKGKYLLFAKNHDYHLDHGLIIVNKRGVPKKALLLDVSDTPARWVSKYGSVTFNLYGRELPGGGINEAGLAIESLWLVGTQYPKADGRTAVVSWLQYQLDNSGSVKDVIASDKKIRIQASTPIPIHFICCDSTGAAAVIEFIGGKMVCHTGSALKAAVIANKSYNDATAELKQYKGFGGDKKVPYGPYGSPRRFVSAADRVRKFDADFKGSYAEAVRYAFDTLYAVRQGDFTKWSVVYDLKKKQIYYKTLRRPAEKIIRLSDCDFNPETPVQVISINTHRKGQINKYFSDYDADVNRWLVYYSFKHTMLLNLLPEPVLNRLADYPDNPDYPVSSKR